jgi:hypothetical protein
VSKTNPSQPPPPAAEPRHKHRRGIRGFFQQIRTAGRDAMSVALGKLIELPPEPDEPETRAAPPVETNDKASWRVSMLHTTAERLRGVADSYIAAKLDEIEARVDAKLDHVEARIDSKIVELHRQLREMRDRELRHRLRLLKITLIFTVLVAALSLGYKWFARYLAG